MEEEMFKWSKMCIEEYNKMKKKLKIEEIKKGIH